MPDTARRIYTCILVDDDDWALMDMQKTLCFDEAGFELIGAYTNAGDALDYVKARAPDVVISDICLGGMNGLEMIGELRRLGYRGEFIIVSGYSEFEFARKAIDQNVSAYLLKPIDYAEGREALRKARGRLDGGGAPMEGGHAIDRVRDYVRQHFQEKLSLDEVAEAFFINKSYLSELFHERFGKSFVQYKNEVRVERAKCLLSDTRLTVSEIAAMCGFDNLSYFALVFRQITGKTPMQYRK